MKSYKNKLIVGLWWSEKRFDILLAPKMFPLPADSINYIANSNHVGGISLDYDILGFSFGYNSVPSGNPRTGNTDYFDLGLNINTQKFRFENSWRRYTGFYDKYTNKYTVPFDSVTPYTQLPHMSVRMVKSKMIYTFNKRRFALGAAYANVKRQVKSSGSWLVVANFYSLNVFSDTSMIPFALQKHYGPVWDGLNRMNIYAYSAGLGATYTLVIAKRFYLNVFGSLGLEKQLRHYYIYPENIHFSYWKTWVAGDKRVSGGFNGKRFFMRLSAIYDINNYKSKDLKFEMQFVAGSFDLGYRFNFKTPKPYRKLQETKLYKML